MEDKRCRVLISDLIGVLIINQVATILLSIRIILYPEENMIRDKITLLGCGNNKAKCAGKMKYCIEHGLDFNIYKLGSRSTEGQIREF